MDYLPSMYIDNEMDLDEKILFVEKIRMDSKFFGLTLELLAQETCLEAQPVLRDEAIEKKWRPPARIDLPRWLRPLGLIGAGFSAAVLVLFAFFQSPANHRCSNRFVLFEPNARQVELAGSFNGWQRVSMKRIGNSGYWELNLPVAFGEHRFAYILDGVNRIADPTLPTREKDDFGGENSIIKVEARI